MGARKRGGARKGARKGGGRKRGGARKAARKGARKAGGRKRGGARKAARKAGGRKRGGRRRKQSPVARVRRVASTIARQAVQGGKAVVDTVSDAADRVF